MCCAGSQLEGRNLEVLGKHTSNTASALHKASRPFCPPLVRTHTVNQIIIKYLYIISCTNALTQIYVLLYFTNIKKIFSSISYYFPLEIIFLCTIYSLTLGPDDVIKSI